MNTPKTKQPKRWSVDGIREKMREQSGTAWSMGIDDDDYLRAIGKITASWTHVENRMITIFGTLIATDYGRLPIRQIYRSIINARSRIAVMKNMLEAGHNNRDKGKEFDEIIERFSQANGRRNNYVHGVWTTRNDGKILMAVENVDDFWHLTESREVKIDELHDFIETIDRLERDIMELSLNFIISVAQEPPKELPLPNA